MKIRVHPLVNIDTPRAVKGKDRLIIGEKLFCGFINQPVALAMEPVAPDGYGGAIKLLVAIAYDGSVLGVRVVNHQETPGLGDAIEIAKSKWVTEFNGRSLSNLDAKAWHVKKDGGTFDQFTGATITPRAVVKAVYHCLEYFKTNRDKLFIKQHKAAS